MSTGKKKNVLVIGGYGFIGRHITKCLRLNGHRVTVTSRYPKPNDDAITLVAHRADHEQLSDAVHGYDAVVNTVGILRQRFGETYDAVHHRFVGKLAGACAKSNVRLIHVSAMGLNNAVRSRFLHSKAHGEEAIKTSNADWFIVRPSLIDGDGGYGAKWFRRIAKWPVHLVPGNARGILNPIHVEDLAEAIKNLVLLEETSKIRREYNLGGGVEMNLFEYLRRLRGGVPVMAVRVPSALVRLASHVFDALHITPLSFGHYELMRFDNRPSVNHLPMLLGRRAMVVGQACEPEQLEVSYA